MGMLPHMHRTRMPSLMMFGACCHTQCACKVAHSAAGGGGGGGGGGGLHIFHCQQMFLYVPMGSHKSSAVCEVCKEVSPE